MTKEKNASMFNMSIKEFEELKNFKPKEEFNGCVIIPTKKMHDSGYMCMKFALIKYDRVVGCVGGGCDVVHINGIGGYRKDIKSFRDAANTQKVPRVSWQIDCLPNGLLRLYGDHWLSIGDFINSDFEVYNKDL